MKNQLINFRDGLVNLLLFDFMVFALFFALYLTNTISLFAFKLFLVAFIALFVIFPFIYKYSYNLQRQAVFLNSMNIPLNPDYDHPEKYGLSASRNFYLKTDDGVSLGIWHILPESFVKDDTDEFNFEQLLGNGQDVVIYNHGNSGNRLSQHRLDLYKLLRRFVHVIAYDYRSYGDSSYVSPTEDGVVRDAISVYKWVANKTKGHVFVWGHSLGSSISLHSLSRLKEDGYTATGVFLEGAFNNMREEISEFPLARMFSYLPWFYYFVVQPMYENGFRFQSDELIATVNSPILILHAEDDRVVPIRLGYKLYHSATRSRTESQGTITFQEFEAKRGFGHKFICNAPELPDLIVKFIVNAKKEVKEKHIS